MAPCFILKWILMLLFPGLAVSGSPVRGVVGQNVTLPCKYPVNNQNDMTTMCWGRGPCPTFQCSQPILWTDGWRVTERLSNRYQLEGNLTQGDVSLTIVNAAEADGGVYCCRVEIPGWFNDQRNGLEVVMERGTPLQALTITHLNTPQVMFIQIFNPTGVCEPLCNGIPDGEQNNKWTNTVAELICSRDQNWAAAVNASDTSSTITARWPLVVSSEVPEDVPTQTMYTAVDELKKTESKETGMYVGISIFVVLLVILVSVLLTFKRYLHSRQKLKTLASSVSFSNTERGDIQNALEARAHAEGNIYTMD